MNKTEALEKLRLQGKQSTTVQAEPITEGAEEFRKGRFEEAHGYAMNAQFNAGYAHAMDIASAIVEELDDTETVGAVATIKSQQDIWLSQAWVYAARAASTEPGRTLVSRATDLAYASRYTAMAAACEILADRIDAATQELADGEA